ncbi:IS3 family transposase, partial [Listeria seeligeri]
MYWQKRLEQKNPNASLEKKIQKIFDEHHGNYGYRRIQ